MYLIQTYPNHLIADLPTSDRRIDVGPGYALYSSTRPDRTGRPVRSVGLAAPQRCAVMHSDMGDERSYGSWWPYALRPVCPVWKRARLHTVHVFPAGELAILWSAPRRLISVSLFDVPGHADVMDLGMDIAAAENGALESLFASWELPILTPAPVVARTVGAVA